MANVRTDEVQLRVVVDGSPARRELAQLAQESVKLQDELRGMKKGSTEATQAMERLAQIGKRQEELRRELGLTGLSLKELRAEAAKLEAQLKTMVPGSEQWVATNARLQEVKVRLNEVGSAAGRQAAAWEAVREQYKLTDMTMEQLEAESRRLMNTLRTLRPDTAEFRQYRRELELVNDRQAQLRTGMGPFARAWSDIKLQVAGAFSVIGAMFAGGLIVNGLRNWVSGSAALSDELANVQKATGMTRDQVQALNEDLRNLNTRTATSDLREIAVGLGQVGEAVSASAVGAIDKINVALGDEFGTNAREITSTISVLRNNLGDIKSASYADDVTRIGNALNELGANGLATAPIVSDIANRVAGVARQFGVASGDILGMAATFQELGISVERGSTAYIRVLQKMAAEPAKFAEVVKAAGGDANEFTRLLNTDMQAAFVQLAKAAKDAGTQNTTFAAILKELDVDGAGVSELLSKMGQNAELLAAKSKLAGEALQSTSSITAEFNTKNNTLGATLDKIGKALAGMFVNSTIMNGLEALVNGFARLLGINESMSVTLEQERLRMLALHAQVLDTNTSAEARVRIIREMQAKYPQYLGNIDAEKVSNEELSRAINMTNQQLIARIILQTKQEQIEEQGKEQADARMRQIELEERLRGRMVEAMDKYNIKQKEGLTLQQQAERVLRKVQEAEQGTAVPFVLRSSQSIRRALDDYTFSLAEVNKQNRIGAELEQERIRLMQLLGISAEEVAPAPGGTGPGPVVPGAPVPGAPTPEAATEAVDTLERLREQLREIQAGMLRDAMASGEREVAEVDAKYAKLRAEILRQEGVTAADLQLLDELYAQERANAIEAGGQKRIDAARRVAEELRRMEQEAADQVFLDQQSAEDREVLQAMQQFDALVALYDKAGVDTADVVKRTEAMIAAIRKKYRQAEKKDAEQELREKRQRDQQMAMDVAGAVGSVNAVLAAFYSSSNQMAYEQTVAAKALGLLQIGISSAVGVAKAIEAGAGLTWPANLGAIASGVAAVLSGIAQARALFGQVGGVPDPSANPNAQGPTLNNVPLGADGMVIDGPGHDRGGLKVYDPIRQQVVAEIEGGETILSRRWTEANAAILPQLLAASKAGARTFITAPVSPVNTGAVRSAMAVPQYAAGGRITRGTALVNAAGPGGGGGTPDWALAMIAEMRRVANGVESMPTTLRAEVVNSPKKDRTDAEYARIKGRNSYRRGT